MISYGDFGLITQCPDCQGSGWKGRDEEGWNIVAPFEKCERCDTTGVIRVNVGKLKIDNEKRT